MVASRSIIVAICQIVLVFGVARAQEDPSATDKQELIRERDRLGQEAGQSRAAGELEPAIKKVRRMLEIERTVTGPQDREVAFVLEYLSSLLRELQDWNAAAGAAEEAASIYRIAFGDKHWRTLSAIDQAVLLRRVGLLAEDARERFRLSDADVRLAGRFLSVDLLELAERTLERARAAREATVGRTSTPVAECLVLRSIISTKRKQTAAAEEAAREAEATFRELLGVDHRDRLVALRTLADAREWTGNVEGARQLYDEYLERGLRMEVDKAVLAQVADHLGQQLLAQGNQALEGGAIEECMSAFARRQQLYEQVLGRDSPAAIESRLDRDHIERLTRLSADKRLQLLAGQKRVNKYQKRLDSKAALAAIADIAQVADEVDRQLGIADPLWADCYVAMARLARDADQFDVAEKFSELVAEHRQQTHGAGHPRTVEALTALAETLQAHKVVLREEGQLAEQMLVLSRLKDVVEAIYGKGHWRAVDIDWQSRITAVLQKLDGDERMEYETILDRLAQADEFRDRGQRAKARDIYNEAHKYFKQKWNKQHTRYPQCLLNAAVLSMEADDLAGAKPLLREAVDRYRDLLGEEHPKSMRATVELAYWHFQIGDYANAELLYSKAIAFFTRDRSLELELADALQGLGQCYLSRDELTTAEPVLARALGIRLNRLGAKSEKLAESWNSLGSFYLRVEEDRAATELLKRAAAIWRSQGPSIPLARCLDNLAAALVRQHDAAEALDVAREAEKFLRHAFPDGHRDLTINAGRIAQCLLALKRPAEAYDIASQSLSNSLQRWHRTVRRLSSRQRLDFATELRGIVDVTLTAALAAEVPAARMYDFVLQYKGTVLARDIRDRIEQRRLVHAGDERTRQLRDELHQATSRFVELMFTNRSDRAPDQMRQELGVLDNRRAELEAELADRTAARSADKDLRAADLDKILPEGVALVDFYNLTGSKPRILAFCCASGRPVRVLDLGMAAPLYSAVTAWRATFGARATPAGSGPSADEPAVVIRERVWDRLPSEVRTAGTILIVPEGPLARFPWSALPVGSEGNYLIDERSVAVIPSAQFLPYLLADSATRPNVGDALLIGDVAYGAVKMPGNTVGPRWRELSGTEQELAELEKLLREQGAKVEVMSKDKASTVAFVRAAPQHALIHLATHGYFDNPQYRETLLRATLRLPNAGVGLSFAQSFAELEPLTMSAVILAGANLPRHDATTGIGLLTALEISNLDLVNARLVVLSACESGLGDLHPAEGSLGLCSALHAAGVRTCIGTLWQVDDAMTAQIMVDFYRRRFVEKKGVLQALCEAQREVKNGPAMPDTARPHRGLESGDPPSRAVGSPFYWAAFTLSGDWR